MLIAFPEVREIDHVFVMKIEGWSSNHRRIMVIDELPMPKIGEWRNVYDVPIQVLNAPFRLDRDELPKEGEYGYGHRFNMGGMYSLSHDWNYPFYGERIGSFVKRLDRANEMPRPTGTPGLVVDVPRDIT